MNYEVIASWVLIWCAASLIIGPIIGRLIRDHHESD